MAHRLPVISAFCLLALLLGGTIDATEADSTTAGGIGEKPEVILAQRQTDPASNAAASVDDPWAGVEELIVVGNQNALLEGISATSVTAFDESELNAIGAADISDLADFTPNLDIRSTSASNPTFFIRGVGLSDFNANASGSVAVYRNGVPINSPATQLGLLYDVEGVTVLRGPQGSGQALNASAGKIQINARRPTGEFNGYARLSYGNYDAHDIEGAIEAPIVDDLLSARFAFRFSDREGYGTNRCAGLPPFSERTVKTSGSPDAGSLCGERFLARNPILGNSGISHVNPGMAKNTNDRNVWSARGILRYQPDIAEMDWSLIGSYLRRDETSVTGLALGTGGTAILPPVGVSGPSIRILGSQDNENYIDPDVVRLRDRLTTIAAEQVPKPVRQPGESLPAFRTRQRISNREILSIRDFALARQLARDLEPKAHEGDYNAVGPNRIETWSISTRGEAHFAGFDFETVVGGQKYERTNFVDADFTPNQLFENQTEDDAWQASGLLSVGREIAEDLDVEVGGQFLREVLDVDITNFTRAESTLSNTGREYKQDSRHYFVYGKFAYRFWEAFELAGGVRYNRSRIKFDFLLGTPSGQQFQQAEEDWSDPTGEIKLTYHFPSEASIFIKFARGWRGGKFNASANTLKALSSVEPESVDAWEVGSSTSWFNDRLAVIGSLFFYRYRNYQVFIVESDQGSPPELETVNAKKAQNYGGEFEVRASPVEALNLSVVFGWLESKFLDFQDDRLRRVEVSQNPSVTELIPVATDFTGNRLPSSPRFTVNLGADFTFDLGRFGRLTPRWDGIWTDDVFFDPTEGNGAEPDNVFLPHNSIGQRAYWLHNFRLTYSDAGNRFEIVGWVRNMTDELYKTYGFDASLVQKTTINFLGEPRTYGMEFKTSW
jgi:outer membrane receptor protein involved in Fe transport